MTQTVYGTKYAATKDLSTTEIAKEIRKDIKALVGTVLPKGTKTSVKTRYFAGGSSIDVAFTALPGVPVFNPEWLLANEANPHVYHNLNRQSDQVRGILKAVEKVVDAYNYDGSDIQTDYFHVRFYGSVKIDWELENERRVAELAAAQADKAEHDRQIKVAAAVETFCNALCDLVKAWEEAANFSPDLSGLGRATTVPQPSFKDLSASYGCPASLTTAVFEAHGVQHVARRFWRADAPTTGKIELYTVEPGTSTEDYFRDVNEFEPNKVDLKAITAIIAQDKSYVPSDAFGSWERFAAIEIY